MIRIVPVTCVCLVATIVLVSLFVVFHDRIVHALQPAVEKIHDLKFGWLIPIAMFFVISFPPLFGHEILAVLCGLVWGAMIGFAITATGTFIGEVANFYTFKHFCQARGDKLQKDSVMYAALCKVIRERGFKVALVARYSAIPGHLTTAIFSVCGMGISTFMLAAVLSLPKQFITVYIGAMLESDPNSSTGSTRKIIADVVGVITLLVTVVAMWYINEAVRKVKPRVIQERQKSRSVPLHAKRRLTTYDFTLQLS
ncbi:snare associated Golgi protein-domain-containing protein [Suillus tomentosus]|nr:snare associated Golgi protein-domain-containing protein [Suillus tomentosus]